MSWNYSDSLGTSKDKVRFRIGDVNSLAPLLTDELISAMLTTYNDNVLRVACVCVKGILAQLTRDTNRSVMGISGSVDQATVHYRDLLRDLIADMNTDGGIYPGAIKIATVDNLDDANGDTMVPPDFRQGQWDMQSTTSAYSKDWDEL